MTPPVLHTLEEAAAILSPTGAITARSLRTEIDNGRLPAVSLDGDIYILEEDMEEARIIVADQRWRSMRSKLRSDFSQVSSLRGTERLREARRRFSYFPKPDFAFRLLESGARSRRVCDAPRLPGVYMVSGVFRHKIITLYVGESKLMDERVASHFRNPTDPLIGFPSDMRRNVASIEERLKECIRHTRLHIWVADRLRRDVEHFLSNVTGAIFEYRERKVDSCEPDEWWEA